MLSLSNTTHRRLTGLLMVAILVFNITLPVVFASGSEDGSYTWMCTSQGLVKIAIDKAYTDADEIPDLANSNHCPYCKLFDIEFDVTNTDLAYPQPNKNLIQLYRSPLTANQSALILSARPLRAPPVSTLI